MRFAVLPDVVVEDGVLDGLARAGLSQALVHPSGRPWTFDDGRVRWAHRRTGPTGAVAVPWPEGEVARSDMIGAFGPGDVDSVAEKACDRSFFLSSTDSYVRVQGPLSSQRQVFVRRIGKTSVASNSVSVLLALGTARIDRTRLALGLLTTRPPQPFACLTPWEGVEAVGIGDWLRLDYSGRASAVRWWEDPGRGVLAADSAAAVRRALEGSVEEAVAGHRAVSADLSGGAGSTSLGALLIPIAGSFEALRIRSLDSTPDEPGSAVEASEALGVRLHLLPGIEANAAAASALTGSTAPDDGPLPWPGLQDYAERVASAMGSLGSTAHVTGFGGEELFGTVPGVFRAMWAESRRDSIRTVARLNPARGFDPMTAIRASMSREPYTDYLERALRCLRGAERWRARDAYSWFAPVAVPPWMSDEGRELVVGAFEKAVASAVVPLGADPLAQQVIESVAHQGGTLRRFGELAGGGAWRAPYLDRRVVRAVLRSPAALRLDPGRDRALLAEAVGDVVPARLFDRSRMHRQGPRPGPGPDLRWRRIAREFEDGDLFSSGLVREDVLRTALRQPGGAGPGLFDLEAAVATEQWLRSASDRESAASHEAA